MENEDVTLDKPDKEEEKILEKMEDTRTSMSEKIEQLEQKVVSTVTGTTEAVTETVEAVKESVQAATQAVADTVATVKETVQGTVEAVTDTVKVGVRSVTDLFSPRKHPWFCMGTSMLAGFVATKLLFPSRRRPEVQAMAAGAASTHGRTTSQVSSTNGGHKERASHEGKASPFPASSKGFFQGITEQLAPELEKVKGMALGMLLNSSRDLLIQAVPQQWKGHFQGIFQNLAEKLHATPSQGEEQPSQQGYSHEEEQDKSHQPEMEKSGNRPSRRGKFDR